MAGQQPSKGLFFCQIKGITYQSGLMLCCLHLAGQSVKLE